MKKKNGLLPNLKKQAGHLTWKPRMLTVINNNLNILCCYCNC